MKTNPENSNGIPIQLDIQNSDYLRQISRQVIRVVYERDHYSCRCCGFRSRHHQQVLNPGGNWRDPDTIVTVCIFCQQCFLMNDVSDMRSGVLIAFPDMGQADLNRLAIELYIARRSGHVNNVEQANSCLNFLKSKRQTVIDQFGSDDPETVATLLRLSNPEVLAPRLSGVRLFPLDRRILREGDMEFNQFPQILAFWRSLGGPYPTDEPTSYPAIQRFVENYFT